MTDSPDFIEAPDIDELDALDSDPESCGVLAKGSGVQGGANAAMLRWLFNPNDFRPLREVMKDVVVVIGPGGGK